MHKPTLSSRQQLPFWRWLPATLLSVGVVLLSACGEDSAGPVNSAPGRKPMYFDVKGLLDAQIKQLAGRHAAVTKRVSLRGSTPETMMVPGVKWADELQLFFQADINKAALRGAYTVDSTVSTDGSGLRRYVRRPGYPNAPVEQLVLRSVGGQPTDIQASVTQTNPLFSASKQLRLHLQNGQLVEYGVTGTQKLVLFDTLRYSTAATVVR